MKKYYIILSRSNTLVALLVRFFSRRYYSHASVAFTPELDPFYSFGRKNPRIMLPAGFISESMTTGYFGVFPKTKVVVLEGEITEEQHRLVQDRLEEFLREKYRYKYNLIGLVTGYLGIAMPRKWHYTCSGFVAYIFRDVLEFDRHFTLVQPEHFLEFDLKTIYEGTAGDYHYEKL